MIGQKLQERLFYFCLASRASEIGGKVRYDKYTFNLETQICK